MTKMPPVNQKSTPVSFLGRMAILIYGIFAYILSIMAILWLIACNAGLLPLGSSFLHFSSTTLGLCIDVLLAVLFGLQHSVMARPHFKAWWTQKIPPFHQQRGTIT